MKIFLAVAAALGLGVIVQDPFENVNRRNRIGGWFGAHVDRFRRQHWF